MPKISIIIPIYNVEDYVSDTIISIEKQNFKDFECLLIDDGSTDNSVKICDEIVKKDSRFKVLHKKNGGQNSARNLGLQNAQGTYITFVDGDDRLPDYALELMYNSAVNNNCDYVSGQRLIINKTDIVDSNELKKIKNGTEKRYLTPFTSKQISSKSLWEKEWFMTAPGNLIKKSLYENLSFNEKLHMAEDQILMKQLFWSSSKIIILDEYVYLYVMREDSITHKRNKYAIDIFESYKIMLKILRKYNLYNRHYLNCFYFYNKWALQHLIKHLEYSYFNDFYKKYKMFIKERDNNAIRSKKIKLFFKNLENPIIFWSYIIIPTKFEYFAITYNIYPTLIHLKRHYKRLISGKLKEKIWESLATPFWLFKFCLLLLLKRRGKND